MKISKKLFFWFQQHRYILLLLFFLVAYTLQGIYLLDPDFGWHLRMGQIILQQRSVPQTDLFSYTMPSYHFIDHEWFSDVIIAFIYGFAGIPGVAFISALVVVLAIYVVTAIAQKKDVHGFWLLLILMTAGTLIQIAGIRPQVWSWLFFALIIYLLHSGHKRWSLFLLPLIFLFWANMHAAFSLGLFYFGFIVVQRFYNRDTKKWLLLTSFIVSVCMTLINPYGINLWREVVITSTSPQIGIIEEWTPSIIHVIFPLWLFVDIAIVLLLFDRKNIDRFTQVFILLIAILFLTGIRNAPFFLLYSLPLVIDAVGRFVQKAHTYKFAKRRLRIATRIFTGITIVFCLITFSPLFSTLVHSHLNLEKALSTTFPVKTTAYLRTHPFQGQLFAPYNWGGYLIWQLPEKKDFIDGRMPTWINPHAPKNESTNALRDFMQIDSPKTLDAAVHRYDITTLLIPPLKQKPPSCGILQRWCAQSIQTSEQSNAQIQRYLTQHHWKLVAKDAVSIIYQR